jgi:hypothetical protein
MADGPSDTVPPPATIRTDDELMNEWLGRELISYKNDQDYDCQISIREYLHIVNTNRPEQECYLEAESIDVGLNLLTQKWKRKDVCLVQVYEGSSLYHLGRCASLMEDFLRGDANLQPAFKNKNIRYIGVPVNDGLLSADDIRAQFNKERETAKKAEAAKNAEKADTAKTNDEATTETLSRGDHMTKKRRMYLWIQSPGRLRRKYKAPRQEKDRTDVACRSICTQDSLRHRATSRSRKRQIRRKNSQPRSASTTKQRFQGRSRCLLRTIHVCFPGISVQESDVPPGTTPDFQHQSMAKTSRWDGL